VIEDCPEPWRMLTAMGAVFFLLGLRFMLLRWREFAITGDRMQAAVTNAETEIRRGVSGLRATVDSVATAERQMCASCETDDRIVQAKSDPPGPSP
jgi:hypothetical protein